MSSLPTRRLAGALLLVPLLAACTPEVPPTSQQGPTGNGSFATVGDVQVLGLTLVAGVGGTNLVGTFRNLASADDALTAVSVGGAKAALEGPQVAYGALPLPVEDPVKIGYASLNRVTAMLGKPGEYQTVTLSFKNAGSEDLQVLVVPAAGYYQGLGPAGAAAAG